MQLNYDVGTKVIMKKEHPCGNKEFEIQRIGIDIKIRCTKCYRIIILPRVEFNKKVKKVLEDNKNEE